MSSDHAGKDIRYHDQIAAEYDRVVVDPRWSSINALFDAAGAHLPRQRRAMLDLGTGTGHMLRRFARSFGCVVAVDHSQAMLRLAEDSISKVRPGPAVGARCRTD